MLRKIYFERIGASICHLLLEGHGYIFFKNVKDTRDVRKNREALVILWGGGNKLHKCNNYYFKNAFCLYEYKNYSLHIDMSSLY